jgi:hypothetical protein
MIKKKVEYLDLIDDEEVDAEATVRLIFMVTTIKLYEQRTGGNFYRDFDAALTAFAAIAPDLMSLETEGLGEMDYLRLLPVMAEPTISTFVVNAIPCLYTEVTDGRYVQNDQTAEKAEESLWLMELLGLDTFIEIFQEITRFSKSKAGTERGKKLTSSARRSMPR